jgi:sigma-B regulation protein RsbU (phosphoserine phosphatase)
MRAKTSGAEDSLHVMFQTGGRSIGRWQMCANLVGALTVTSYFVFFDRVFPAMRVQNTFLVVGIMFPILAAIAMFIFYFWLKDLKRFLEWTAQNKKIEPDLRRSLDLAKEVQQNLLPAKDPQFPGLDIAGKSIYCDETGGDYFDFFDDAGTDTPKYGVVIGDVSDHGIPSALLMASARAFLRQRTALSGSIADIVGDVNRQLTQDVEDTGRFITLFYLQIDMPNRRLSWVRAGHEPALLYDPAADRFEELSGEGIALGVDGDWQYAESKRDDLRDGQIILLSTDGIWEARNPQDQMFGRKAVTDIIRRHTHATAANIQDALLAELSQFQQGVAPADDITLVIIKVTDSS